MTSPLAKDIRPPDPLRRRNAPAALELTRSNSTANIFLGGSRKKSWMTAIPPPRERSTTDLQTSSAVSSRPVSPPVSRPTESPPTLPVAAVSSSPPTRPEGMRAFSSNSQSNLSSFRGNQSPVPVPVASSTPAVTARNAASRPQISPASNTPPSLTRSPASHNLPLPRHKDAPLLQQKQRQLQVHLEQQSVSSLPSPDPTIPPRAHASPIAANERHGSIASPSATAFPSPPLQQALSNHPWPRSNGPAYGTFSASPPNNQQGPSSPAPQVHPRVGSYTPPVHPYSTPTATTQTNAPPTSRQFSNTALQPPNRNSPPITNEFFARANDQLEAFGTREGYTIGAAGSVDAARFSLLQKACAEKDLIYLTLHQLYCLHTCDVAWVRRLSGFSHLHEHGLDALQQLLVHNSKVADRFLAWSVNFPYPLPDLLPNRLYQEPFQKTMCLLVNFANNWASFEKHVISVQHPPLVETMVKTFGVVSSVLNHTMYLCFSRRLFGNRAEGHMQNIFNQDVRYYDRSLMEPVPADQRQHENNHIVHMYRQAIAVMGRHAADAGMVAAPAIAQNMPHSIQAIPDSVSAPATLPTRQNPPQHASPFRPIHVNTQNRGNDVAPPSVRSPQITGPSRFPGHSMSSHPPAQHREVEPRGHPLQTTGAMPSPVVTASPQLMAPRGLPQRPPDPHPQHPQQFHLQQPEQPRLRQQAPQAPQSQPLQHFQESQHSQPPQRTLQHQQPQYPGSPATRTQNPPQTHMPAGPRRTYPTVPYAPPRQRQRQSQPQPQQARRAAMPLLPPPNVPAVMNTRPNPNRLAIHQAHLRDPVNEFVSVGATGVEQTELLPHLTSFLLRPTILREPDRSVKWNGSLSDREIKRLPFIQSQGRGQRMHRTMEDGTQTYRLRCIKIPRSTAELSEHSWAVAETVWPQAIYMHVNNEQVLPRRKLHNARDLPLDITQNLRQGENTVNFHFVLGPGELEKFTYAVAVEVLTFRSLAPAKALAQAQPAAESRDRICGKLAPKSNDDDDELRIVSDDLKFTLIDPYTAQVFNVPARGSQCEHTECFDHETFLQTRLLKTGDQSAVEADWKCPICSRDARPQNLIVDSFLASVRDELERTNRLEGARFLIIKADGSWDVTIDAEQDNPHPSRTAVKRKSSAIEDGPIQRPKVDRSISIPEPAQSPAPVIVLD